MRKPYVLAILLLACCAGSFAQGQSSIPNPVLPHVADAGVIRFNGQYYIGGVSTYGALYRSSDLVHWKGPDTVLTMHNEWATPLGIGGEQIHSNDIHYVNGQFHFYWNVNYWGRTRNVVHIGHAVSNSIEGPFVEPVKNTWFDSRLDPKLFVDDDGQLYFYSVKFSDGNTIWGRRMRDPSAFAGEPVYLFSSFPNTWETMDNRVAEGPWVIRYRDRYYMMYNANHTSPAWGNYALGVAEASAPLGFNQGSKYSDPVLQSNQVDFEALHPDVLQYSTTDGARCRYTLRAPAADWINTGYHDSTWQTGGPGFGSDMLAGSTARSINTLWKTPGIWIRKRFQLTRQLNDHFALRVHHDGPTSIFLNGSLVYQAQKADYRLINLDTSAKKMLLEGENLLCVQSQPSERSNYISVSLFDLKNEIADDILFTPGQPNIVKGPNGFEWWLVYMANKNNEPRGQFVNRIFFHDRKLTVDGITDSNTPGYHPPPRSAGFMDCFDDTSSLRTNWKVNGTGWKLDNEELLAQSPGNAFLKVPAASSYVIEVSIRMSNSGAGVYAWWKDKNHWLKIECNKSRQAWISRLCLNGRINIQAHALAPDFNYEVYHKLTIYKNAGIFTVLLDDIPAPGNAVVIVPSALRGIPGIYASGSNARYDGISYTAGWDEYGKEITGWKTSTGENPAITDSGLISARRGSWKVYKGDVLKQYEFSLQVNASDTLGSAGVYALYADPDNYLKCGFNFRTGKLMIDVKKNGAAIDSHDVDLRTTSAHWADIAESDFMQSHFKLGTSVNIKGLRLKRSFNGHADSLISGISKKFRMAYRQGEQWLDLNRYQVDTLEHPGFELISFDPVWADELTFDNENPADHQLHMNKIWVNEICRLSCNFRVVRCDGQIRMFVDNRLVGTLADSFPPSQVGLYTNDQYARFNGITLFEIR